MAGDRSRRWIATSAGLPGEGLLADDGVPIEQISRLVGHSGTSAKELVYRKQIRPMVEDGATAMDRIFPRAPG